MSDEIKLGLVGLGKIARDQHLPAIASTPGLRLAAVASRHGKADDLPNYPDLTTMLAAEPALDAIILCQPPQVRYDTAREALLAGKHVFLEKPPGVTLSQVEALRTLAESQGVTLFASWHSRCASGVDCARDWLKSHTLRSGAIAWKEDVRHWHPGQAWIWEAGGFGVFDPGINALSILTGIVPEPVLLVAASMEIPSNCAAPIAARLAMRTASGAPIDAEFDFRQTGQQTWDIRLDAEDGSSLLLSHGGHRVEIDGRLQEQEAAELEAEYPRLYRRFAELIAAGTSDVDLTPLQLVADAFLCGQVHATEAFYD